MPPGPWGTPWKVIGQFQFVVPNMAALQDYNRAVIVGGSHSFGKGTVQAMVNLDQFITDPSKFEKSFGALSITIQQFYRRVDPGSAQQLSIFRPNTFDIFNFHLYSPYC